MKGIEENRANECNYFNNHAINKDAYYSENE